VTAHADPRLVVAVLERAAADVYSGNDRAFAIHLAAEQMILGGFRGQSLAAGTAAHAVTQAAQQAWRAVDPRFDAGRILDAAVLIRDHILSVALFCGALAGALPPTMRDLLAAHVAGDATAWPVLRDLALERGFGTDLAQWLPPAQCQAWIETGPHEHAWLKWYSGDRARAARECVIPGDLDFIRRCTCGMFEHEYGDEHRHIIGEDVDPEDFAAATGYR